MLEAIKWRLYWILFKAAFFIINRNPRLRETLAPLDGKTFRLCLSKDLKGFTFKVARKGYITDSPHIGSPDLVIRGRFRTFWKILWGKIDADSAFFHRKITIEGNLAMALMLKNTLDNFLFC